MASNSSSWNGHNSPDQRPTDPVVFVVFERESDFEGGVPYERVVQVVRRRLGVSRPEAAREIETLVDAGRLDRVDGDRLELP